MDDWTIDSVMLLKQKKKRKHCATIRQQQLYLPEAGSYIYTLSGETFNILEIHIVGMT